MALTKVKLIADGTIVQSHLNASHGITTADIGEGSNLYYTDARARAAVSVSGNALSYDSSTGVITSNFEESPVFTGNVELGDYSNVSMSASSTGQLKIYGNAYQGAIALDATGMHVYHNSSSRKLILGTNETARLTIEGTGEVGIGTDSPASKLHVNGASGAADLFAIGDAAIPTSGSEYGVAMIKTNSTEFALNVTAYNANSQGARFYSHGAQTIFLVTTGLYGDVFKIDGGGNVGIRNTVASAIDSASGLGTLVVGNGGASSQGITIYTGTATYGALNFADATSGTGAYQGYIKFDHTNNSFGHYIGNVERMRIDSNGAVGIGRNTASYRLSLLTNSTVQNGIYVSGGTGNSNHALYVENQSGSAEHFAVRGDGQIRLNASGTGNVLVNTTVDNTYDKLQVIGNAWIGGNSTRGIRIADGGTYGSIVGINQAISAYAALELRASGTNGQLFLDTNGNVGIGTLNPVQRLHVNGQVLFRTTTADGGKNRFQLIPGGSSDAANLYLYYGNSGDGTVSVRINAQGNSYFNGGNIGIGTINPQEKLHVAGRTISGSSTNYASLNDGFSTSTTTRENGGVVTLVSNGEYRYYERVCQISTGAGSAGYWHIKTNINWSNSFVMYMAKFYGYIYGQAAIMDITVAGYAYTSGPISTNVINNSTNSSSVATYASTDGKLVFRVDLAGSTYYAGLWMDIGFQNPTGGALDFEILAQAFNTGTTYY